MRPTRATQSTEQAAGAAAAGTQVPGSAVVGYLGALGTLDLLVSGVLARVLTGTAAGAATVAVFLAFFVPLGVASVLSADRVLVLMVQRHGR
ncbi:hypothetical protein [Kitasatospora cheerisanensis]|uniref:Uncharacterized protein n=1 Tax=Kitasatospora cheerisanensis KCTC 2395 TaxID=1348663 RepID=A0A066YJC6_9ACTN|nr:hypothetical protein [Kitasatospora cheerisanensis]KDN81242.1 hypothetical protein KCH_68740 [Kitasatospora cheerisanensis KCTC 2395]